MANYMQWVKEMNHHHQLVYLHVIRIPRGTNIKLKIDDACKSSLSIERCKIDPFAL